MSNPITTFEAEPIEAFDHAMVDLVDNPPYDDRTMVHFLADGRFIIEGRPSDSFRADLLYCELRNTEDAWEAYDKANDYERDPVNVW